MTIEKTCFISPEDLEAVRIACNQCGSFTVVPLKEIASVSALLERNCIGCGKLSGFRRDTRDWQDVLILGEKLASLQAIMQGMSVTYSLKIKCPE